MPRFNVDSGPSNVLSPEELEVIGRIAVEWTYVETLLERLIAQFFEIPMDKSIWLFSNLGYRSRHQTILAICKQLADIDAFDSDGLKAILVGIDEANTARNHFIHASYIGDSKTGGAQHASVRLKGSFRIKMEPLAAKDLWSALRLIRKCQISLLLWGALHGYNIAGRYDLGDITREQLAPFLDPRKVEWPPFPAELAAKIQVDTEYRPGD